MTRETKIGLLVGLAFIIVIGILLSDHLTTRGEMKPAELTQVTDHVRSGVAGPASAQPPLAPVTAPIGVTPTGPVATSDELKQNPTSAHVRIGGPDAANTHAQGPSISIKVGTPDNTDSATVVTHFSRGQSAASPTDGLLVAQGVTGPAAASDPQLVPVDPKQSTPPTTVKPLVKEYKATKGDTVTRWAVKFLGADTNANRKLIIDANPSLKANPAKIMIGQTYLIPLPAAKQPVAAAAATPAVTIEPTTGTLTPSTASATTATVTTADPAPTTEVAGADANTVTPSDVAGGGTAKLSAKSDAKSAAKSTSTYVAKEGDTLTKIAGTQLGDKSLWTEIRDLNKDVLRGKKKDGITTGMTLKIPAKSAVASR